MIHGTALGEKGIFSLERIREFFEKMKIPIEQIKIKGGYFDSQEADDKKISDFYKEVGTGKFCPAATIVDDKNNLHVVTIDSALPNRKYQAKNTFENNKKITLSHYRDDRNRFSNWIFKSYIIYDAIIIRFELDQSK